jgi:hypothetical protein
MSDRIIQKGRFKGKKIEFAPSNEIEKYQTIADDFMLRIFEFEPGEYMITDESSLHDFDGVLDLTMDDILEKIRTEYGLDVAELKLNYLSQIFAALSKRRYTLTRPNK